MIRDDLTPGNAPGESTPFRPDVIAAFKTSTNAAELTELLRLVVDVCTPLSSRPDGPDRVEVTFRDGRLARVVVLPESEPGEPFVLSPVEARLIRARRALHARLEDRDEGFASRLKTIARLAPGWDGYEAPTPGREAVDLARSFLEALAGAGVDPTRVAPSVAGGVGVSRRRGGRKVYVEFRNDGRVLALFSDGGAEPTVDEIPAEPSAFPRLVGQLRAWLDAAAGEEVDHA